jgi:hypothetical protein
MNQHSPLRIPSAGPSLNKKRMRPVSTVSNVHVAGWRTRVRAVSETKRQETAEMQRPADLMGFGLCLSSGVGRIREHTFLETGSVSVLR